MKKANDPAKDFSKNGRLLIDFPIIAAKLSEIAKIKKALITIICGKQIQITKAEMLK